MVDDESATAAADSGASGVMRKSRVSRMSLAFLPATRPRPPDCGWSLGVCSNRSDVGGPCPPFLAEHPACEDETAVKPNSQFAIPKVPKEIVYFVSKPELGPLRKKVREMVGYNRTAEATSSPLFFSRFA